MSYAPIYNKLRELEERLAVVEAAPKPEVSPSNTITDASLSGYENLGVLSEIATLRADLDKLFKECALNSSAVSLLSTDNSTKDAVDVDVSAIAALATKEEVAALATKEEVAALATKEEVATLATKGELFAIATKEEVATLATKDEIIDLITKFDNIVNVLSQLNDKVNEAHTKIASLE